MTPLIGVTGPRKKGRLAWCSAWLALRRAGAQPKRLRPPYRADLLNGVSALVIGGGTHIEPVRYQQDHLEDYLYDLERDELEWQVLKEADARALPVLGICRGAQMINVFYGGSLWQDLEAALPGLRLTPTFRAKRAIKLEPDSVVARAMGTNEVRVNSLHKQGINRLGQRLRIAARDADGIVQAIETTDDARAFVVGVQWHPEYLPLSRAHQRLFHVLVEVTRGKHASHASQTSRLVCDRA
jgi:putative glutamine amidotransferase